MLHTVPNRADERRRRADRGEERQADLEPLQLNLESRAHRPLEPCSELAAAFAARRAVLGLVMRRIEQLLHEAARHFRACRAGRHFLEVSEIASERREADSLLEDDGPARDGGKGQEGP